MKYDGAEYFFLNFEGDELENEAGGTHIGMFLAWANFDKLGPCSGPALCPMAASFANCCG
jgi:hypothetical protein